MFQLIIIIVILYFVIKKNTGGISGLVSPSLYLNKILNAQQFSNIKLLLSTSSFNLTTADSHGENYLFATKNNGTTFSLNDIESIYEKAKKFHIHNVVILTSQDTNSSTPLNRKIREYEFEVWNSAKIKSLLANSNNSSYTKSVLRTSNTSYDKCKIDNTPVDPIQSGSSKSHSLFTNPFQRPTRL